MRATPFPEANVQVNAAVSWVEGEIALPPSLKRSRKALERSVYRLKGLEDISFVTPSIS